MLINVYVQLMFVTNLQIFFLSKNIVGPLGNVTSDVNCIMCISVHDHLIQNPHFRVRLQINADLKEDIIIQPHAPVSEIIYNSKYTKVRMTCYIVRPSVGLIRTYVIHSTRTQYHLRWQGVPRPSTDPPQPLALLLNTI